MSKAPEQYRKHLKQCGECKQFPRWLETDSSVRVACEECGKATRKFDWDEAGHITTYGYNNRENVIDYWNDRQSVTQNLCQHVWRRKV